MMRTRWVIAAMCAGLAAPALSAAPVQGYLTDVPIDLAAILPAAPQSGSPADEADRATFRDTRALAGTARWQQAIGDVDESVPAMLADFSSAAGPPLSVAGDPRLAHLLQRMRPDVATAVNGAKDHFNGDAHS